MSNCSQVPFEKVTLMNLIGKHLCGSPFFNKVSCLRTKERLLHSCFLVSFTKYFWTLFLQNTSGWLFLLNTFFYSLRQPQPQKMFPLTLLILNIFEENYVNCPWTALSGGPKQTVSCDIVDLLLIKQAIFLKCCWKLEAVAQLSSVKMRFCKTWQIS